MTARIRGSDVYVVEDLERILTALAGAARRYAGEYGAGYADALRDVAAGVGATVDAPMIERVHEVVEYRHERTVERYQAPAERQFKIVGQREAPALEQYQAAPELAETDVDFDDFVPGRGEVRRMDAGWMWLGNDGSKRFYPIQQWAEISADDARALGYLVAENRRFILAVRSSLEARRRQLGQPAGVLPTERRMLR